MLDRSKGVVPEQHGSIFFLHSSLINGLQKNQYLKEADEFAFLITMMRNVKPRIAELNAMRLDGKKAETNAWIDTNVLPEHRERAKSFLVSPLESPLPEGTALHDLLDFASGGASSSENRQPT